MSSLMSSLMLIQTDFFFYFQKGCKSGQIWEIFRSAHWRLSQDLATFAVRNVVYRFSSSPTVKLYVLCYFFIQTMCQTIINHRPFIVDQGSILELSPVDLNKFPYKIPTSSCNIQAVKGVSRYSDNEKLPVCRSYYCPLYLFQVFLYF